DAAAVGRGLYPRFRADRLHSGRLRDAADPVSVVQDAHHRRRSGGCNSHLGDVLVLCGHDARSATTRTADQYTLRPDAMWDAIIQAFGLVLDPYVLWVCFASAMFGMFVGAMPGLTATMATALLVPVTFFMDPVPAIGAIVTATAMAIFAGDIPAALMRIPGTPASAAYTDESYLMSRKGLLDLNLGSNLVFSATGGLFGVAILIVAAPILAEIALNFSSFEYFWLAGLGLT